MSNDEQSLKVIKEVLNKLDETTFLLRTIAEAMAKEQNKAVGKKWDFPVRRSWYDQPEESQELKSCGHTMHQDGSHICLHDKGEVFSGGKRTWDFPVKKS